MSRSVTKQYGLILVLIGGVFIFAWRLHAAETEAPIDWDRAKQLYQKSQQGETLTPDEQAYLQRAKAQRGKGGRSEAGGVRAAKSENKAAEGADAIDWPRAQQIYDKAQRGETLTPDERAYLDRARAARAKGAGAKQAARRTLATAAQTSTSLTPLCDLAGGAYKGESGGLYGGGSNAVPSAHLAAAQKELAKLQPLDAQGNPAPNGKLVLISIGMSNTTMEFQVFKRIADRDPDKSSNLVIVDGAQGGMHAGPWVTQSRPWDILSQRLHEAGVTTPQVQVVWLKQAWANPAALGDFPAHARRLQADVQACLNKLVQRYPNVRVCYLSSRIYAGYAATPLNPEPYAYEGAFAMRWLIQDQIAGAPALNYDPRKGAVKSPLLLWGPYLWTNGLKGRKIDALKWEARDVGGDGTHPSPSGCRKVADLLLKFCKEDPLAKSWFLKAGSSVAAKQAAGYR